MARRKQQPFWQRVALIVLAAFVMAFTIKSFARPGGIFFLAFWPSSRYHRHIRETSPKEEFYLWLGGSNSPSGSASR